MGDTVGQDWRAVVSGVCVDALEAVSTGRESLEEVLHQRRLVGPVTESIQNELVTHLSVSLLISFRLSIIN